MQNLANLPWVARVGSALVWFSQTVAQLAVYGLGLITGMKVGEKLINWTTDQKQKWSESREIRKNAKNHLRTAG